MPQPRLMPWRGGFDEGLVDAEGGGGDGLEVEVGVVATGGESFAEAALHEALGDSQLVDEVTLVVGGWEGHLLLMIGVRGRCGNGVVSQIERSFRSRLGFKWKRRILI